MKRKKKVSTLKLSSYKLEDFLYLNAIKINLKKNKKSCSCEILGWLLKTKRGNMKLPFCKGVTIMEAFLNMAVLISKQNLQSETNKNKIIKVPKLI